ncbi:eukaryotic translation initiation factor 5A-1 [Cynoglossus semilaevis]|uniref:eukaryotic translation initiation factor 5A-1 n=1 Tax=Cynoglossus semilaevis TaxID=244447 RepID=UPI000494FABB|nr:eukaryotic translation initiation factor 5A-1 [Cynoglossus semilaevis]XP_024913412.1 eukaryotic translation initiation factor 5A-1 [Cynoglossus semilaevis]
MEFEFTKGDAGASLSYPIQCSALRKNGYVLLKGHPCKIVEMTTSKTGKHGHAKVHLVGINIFTGKKIDDICPSTHNMEVPNVKKDDYQLVLIDGDYADLMDDNGELFSQRLPDDNIGKEIKKMYEECDDIMVTITKAMNDEIVTGWRHGNTKD